MWRYSKGGYSNVSGAKKSPGKKIATEHDTQRQQQHAGTQGRHVMEIVRPASRRFWEEDKEQGVRVDPLVSPAVPQRERRDPGRGREVGEVKIPPQDGQPKSGSCELRKLAFTVEAGGLILWCYVALPYVSLCAAPLLSRLLLWLLYIGS